jgi:hypothetical protein
MSACAGQDLSVLDTGLLFPGYFLYVNGDDAHDDGTGKCDSIVDRWSSKTLVQATAGNRFTIASGTLPGTHKTLEGTGKSLGLVDAIASRLAARHDYTEIVFFNITSLGVESQLVAFSGAGAMQLTMYSTFSPSSGSKITTRNGGATVDHNVTYARSTAGFHCLAHTYNGTTGTVTAYLDGVAKGTVNVVVGQDPATLDTITLGGGSHVCKFHQWAVYDSCLSAADVATAYGLMAAAAA